MKKTIALSALVLSILAGLVSGSLALYTTTVNVGTGSVVAKKFKMTAAQTSGFGTDVKIAPTKVVDSIFTVANYDATNTTETNMDLDITIALSAATDKTAIPNVTAKLCDATGVQIPGTSTVTGTGTITLNIDKAFTANNPEEKAYMVRLEWVSDNTTDINYQGPSYGSAYTVTVTGTQDGN